MSGEICFRFGVGRSAVVGGKQASALELSSNVLRP
jgi:hypothetical protein